MSPNVNAFEQFRNLIGLSLGPGWNGFLTNERESLFGGAESRLAGLSALRWSFGALTHESYSTQFLSALTRGQN